jgi:pseudouridine synthase
MKEIKDSTIRLDKFLANRGISARRNIEDVLKAQIVTINGKRAKEPGVRFDPMKDTVLVDGKKLEVTEYVYIKINKPKDVISTASDERGRKTVVSMVPSKQRLYPVGRLDQDTTGLLLLTNDGELANRLTHPRYHVPKIYELTIRGSVAESKLANFRRGVRLEDGMTAKAGATILSQSQTETIVEAVLHEGKKRQIRRMCEVLHLPLIALKRIAIGPILLGDLKLGKYQNLTEEEVAALKKEAGIS